METLAEPFAILANIAQRSTEGKRGLPQQLDAKPMWSGIGIQIAGRNFVVPMNEVAEVLEPPTTTRIPGVKPWVKGVANVRGRLLPLIDLEMYFSGQLSPNRKRHRVLVMDVGEFYCGVLVNDLYGMQHFSFENFTKETGDAEEHCLPYLKGGYQQGEKLWTVFSLYELARDPQFFHVSAH